MLETIITGKVKMPPRLFVYGTEGVGKTCFGAGAPKPIFIPAEAGCENLDVARFPKPQNYADILKQIGALIEEKHDYQTVVVDTADAVCPLIEAEVLAETKARNLATALGGYGAGYAECVSKWREIISGLEYLRQEKSMTVIILAHYSIRTAIDPENPEYLQYQPKMREKEWHLLTEWADCVFFATKKYIVSDGQAKAVGSNGGERIMRTEGSPSCIAKNRYGLPAELPLNYDEFYKLFNGKDN